MSQEQIEDLERELDFLKKKLETEFAAQLMRAPNQWRETGTEILAVERKIASIRGDEYAEVLKFPTLLGFNWCAVGGFAEEARLICDLRGEPGSAVVTFVNTMAMKIGKLNDEVIEGHRLYGKGLDVIGTFVVHNSRWLEQFRFGMELHCQYDAGLWSRMRHFLFRDKGGDFECLATDFDVKLFQEPVSVRIGKEGN